MKAKLAQLGLDTTSDAPDAFAAIIKADIAKWAKVIKEANIKAGRLTWLTVSPPSCPALSPGIHAFLCAKLRRGWPGQARP